MYTLFSSQFEVKVRIRITVLSIIKIVVHVLVKITFKFSVTNINQRHTSIIYSQRLPYLN